MWRCRRGDSILFGIWFSETQSIGRDVQCRAAKVWLTIHAKFTHTNFDVEAVIVMWIDVAIV